ncbi:hypothetical protein CR513_47938, partial [Mucuna pruriens]
MKVPIASTSTLLSSPTKINLSSSLGVAATSAVNVSTQINSNSMLNGTNFKGFISEYQSARKFLEEIEQFFTKNEKAKTSNLLAKLIFMKYKGR